MKKFAYCLVIIAISAAHAVAANTCISEYFRADKLAKAGQTAAAATAMEHAFRLAVTEGNAIYVGSAGSRAAFLRYDSGRVVEAGQLARDVIGQLAIPDASLPYGGAAQRAELFGFVERGLLTQGQIGAAWQANRAAAASLRQKAVGVNGDGKSIQVADLDTLPPELREHAWRLLEREAQYLELAGHSPEALALLAASAAKATAEMPAMTAAQRFYPSKARATYAEMLDFLGWKQQAMAEQSALLQADDTARVTPSRLTLQLNLLRNQSQWDGPSEAILAKARTIGDQLNALGKSRGVARLLAKMELDLKQSKEALATLAKDAAALRGEGAWFDAVYAQRDSLTARALLGEDNLDAEFIDVLAKMRSQGNKCGEPTIYVEYGRYLGRCQRHAEAIQMFREALRLVRAFGRSNHESPILCHLITSHLDAGDLEGASRELAALEAFLTAHPELPLERRVAAASARAECLIALGQSDAARQIYQAARELGKALPAWQLRAVAPEVGQALFAQAASQQPAPAAPAKVAAAPGQKSPVRLQPAAIETLATPGNDADTRFFVVNPLAVTARGQLVATGPGAEITGQRLRFHAGQAPRSAQLPLVLASGSDTPVDATASAADGANTCEVSLAWLAADGSSGKAATWAARWDAAAADCIVLDAGVLQANPFHSITFTHQLAAPADGAPGIAFRLRSPEPLRIEYYDSSSGHLLAIDANGNGDFTDEGDLHLANPSGVAAAWISIALPRPAVEIRIFALTREPLFPAAKAIVLSAEVLRDGAWSQAAEDVLN